MNVAERSPNVATPNIRSKERNPKTTNADVCDRIRFLAM